NRESVDGEQVHAEFVRRAQPRRAALETLECHPWAAGHVGTAPQRRVVGLHAGEPLSACLDGTRARIGRDMDDGAVMIRSASRAVTDQVAVAANPRVMRAQALQ